MRLIISAFTFLIISATTPFFCFAEKFSAENYFYAESALDTDRMLFLNLFESDYFTPEFHPPSEPFKNDELFRINPYASYDAKINYKMDFNFYDKKLQIVPKLRIKRTIEDKIFRGSKTTNNTAFSEPETILPSEEMTDDEVSPEKEPDVTKLPDSSKTSSLTNSIYVGMDLSYAIDKDIFIDSNLTFYQKELQIKDRNPDTRQYENKYSYEGNAMAVSIGLRKKITPSLSAGLIYSWEKWLNETEDFKTEDPSADENKASEDAQEAFNLILRYDF